MAFSEDLYDFLSDLADHNEREWFKAHKRRYEQSVKEPALQFIRDFEPHLKAISPEFQAIAKASGGSLFRIYRDTRFSKDKSPYKTHTGVQFRHVRGKDAHAPGFYLHLQPGEVGAAVGIWHPENKVLNRIRDAIVAQPDRWGALKDDLASSGRWEWFGESLKRAPRGYDPDHPYIDDLKRKSVGVWTKLSDAETIGPDFVEHYAAICAEGAPVAAFVCEALGLPY
jgi:uncharacterized protein (TIGR02453 family)